MPHARLLDRHATYYKPPLHILYVMMVRGVCGRFAFAQPESCRRSLAAATTSDACGASRCVLPLAFPRLHTPHTFCPVAVCLRAHPLEAAAAQREEHAPPLGRHGPGSGGSKDRESGGCEGGDPPSRQHDRCVAQHRATAQHKPLLPASSYHIPGIGRFPAIPRQSTSSHLSPDCQVLPGSPPSSAHGSL